MTYFTHSNSSGILYQVYSSEVVALIDETIKFWLL